MLGVPLLIYFYAKDLYVALCYNDHWSLSLDFGRVQGVGHTWCPFPEYFKLFVLNYGFVVPGVFHLTGSDVIWREKVSLWGLMMSLSTGSDITMTSLTLTEHAQCHGEHASPWLPITL